MNKHGFFSKFDTEPVVIGGVGGSGTRLVAQCLKEAGFHIGDDLNVANDNLWFTLLFKRVDILSSSEEEFDSLVEIFLKAMTGNTSFTRRQVELIEALASEDRAQHPAHWLRQRANTLFSNSPEVRDREKWGWKEPNSHIVLDRLIDRIRGMKYIHVARNGLDMAHSTNQNQLRLWGGCFLNEEFDTTPYYSLRYWCIAHKRVLRIGESMKGNFLFLNYDQLCVNPRKGVKQLLDFIGVESGSLMSQLAALVKQPDSIGRFRKHGKEIFAEEDIAFVKFLGFDVNGGESVEAQT